MFDNITLFLAATTDSIAAALPEMRLFLPATWITLQLALVSLVAGLILAFIFMLCEQVKNKAISWSTTAVVTVIRSLPELLIVVGVYNGIPALFNLFIDGFSLPLGFTTWHIQCEALDEISFSPFVCGVIALSLLYGAYASQTLRGAFKAIPKGQTEAAKALCLSKMQICFRIVMPQIWRHALPGLSNQWLVLLKDTALVSLITVNDIMFQAQASSLKTHSPFTWYLFAAAIYFVITILSQKIIKFIEYRVNQHVRGVA